MAPTSTSASTAAPAAQPVVLVGAAARAVAQLAGAAEHSPWELARAARLAEAELAAGGGSIRALVVDADEIPVAMLRRLARQHPATAIVAWAEDLTSDEVGRLLLAGADDVLLARMGPTEVHARMARVTGNAGKGRVEQVRLGELMVDAFRGEVTWRGADVTLSNRERDVLDVLAHEGGRTLRRNVIYERVWGHAMPAGDRNVDVNVRRLRSRLAEATDDAVSIENVSGVGYRLRVPDTPTTPEPSRDES
jgi:DNA-binding response OmpR family regulator